MLCAPSAASPPPNPASLQLLPPTWLHLRQGFAGGRHRAEGVEGMQGFNLKTRSVSHNSQETEQKKEEKKKKDVPAGRHGGFENL